MVLNSPVGLIDYFGLSPEGFIALPSPAVMRCAVCHGTPDGRFQNIAAFSQNFEKMSPTQKSAWDSLVNYLGPTVSCDEYPVPAPRCCGDDGKLCSDNYPERARSICRDFIAKYKNSMQVRFVARCLIDAEKQCQSKKSCKERNECRFDAHLKCYFSTGFKEPFEPWGLGLPDGGAELGWEELFPDWRKSKIGF